MHSLDFGRLRYTADVLLDVQCVRVVLFKDHDQVVQHGDVPVESQVRTHKESATVNTRLLPSLHFVYIKPWKIMLH